MNLVILMLLGSLAMGMFFKKLDRKAYVALVGLAVAAAAGYYFFTRFL